MQVKNTNASFKPVTVTFETAAEYEAFREIIHGANDNCAFDGKAGEVMSDLYDEFDLSNFED